MSPLERGTFCQAVSVFSRDGCHVAVDRGGARRGGVATDWAATGGACRSKGRGVLELVTILLPQHVVMPEMLDSSNPRKKETSVGNDEGPVRRLGWDFVRDRAPHPTSNPSERDINSVAGMDVEKKSGVSR